MNDEVNAVGIHPPAFMETAATAWFHIMEAQFALRKVTVEETKFYHILAALPPEVVARLPNTIISQKSYEDLKVEVIQLYERTKPELFDRLTSTQPLSGRPSIYLQNILQTVQKVGVG